MAILIKKLSPPVLELLLTKQFEMRKEKGHVVSLATTIEKLLKDAYLSKDKKEKS